MVAGQHFVAGLDCCGGYHRGWVHCGGKWFRKVAQRGLTTEARRPQLVGAAVTGLELGSWLVRRVGTASTSCGH